MSYKIKKDGEWVTVANGSRMFVGTTSAIDAAIARGELAYPDLYAATDDGAENTDYTTDEVYTGKKWIDGNKIYRKVVTTTLDSNLSGYVTIEHGIQNIATPLRIVFGYATNGTSHATIPAEYDDNTYIRYGNFTKTRVDLNAGTTNWILLKQIVLVVEYTKAS